MVCGYTFTMCRLLPSSERPTDVEVGIGIPDPRAIFKICPRLPVITEFSRKESDERRTAVVHVTDFEFRLVSIIQSGLQHFPDTSCATDIVCHFC